MSSVEQAIWGNEAPQGNVSTPLVESVRDRLSAVPAGAPQSRCAAHGVTGCLACLVAQRDSVKTPVQAAPAVASPVVQAAPIMAPAHAAEPVPEVVRRAQTLANQIETSDRLRKRITALELSLQSARNELQASEEARIAAQTALRELIEGDAQEKQ